jgi:Family of unknown function (DUF6193)
VDWGLYPDIAHASSLRLALKSAFDRAGHEFDVLLPSAPAWRDVGAVVRNEGRSVDVVMGSQERVFTMDFRAPHSLCLASGSTSELAAVGGSIDLWLSGALVRDLNAVWPFVIFSPWAEACERGEGIEFTWQQFLANPRQAPQLTALHSFLAAAMSQPRLRALYPFTSVGVLGFRPAVHHTHSVGPWIRPLGDDRYLVRGPGRHEVGAGDAAQSVELALTVLDAVPRTRRNNGSTSTA